MVKKCKESQKEKTRFALITALTCLVITLSGCGTGKTVSDNALSPETLKNVARVLWMETYDPRGVPPKVLTSLRKENNSPKAFGQRMRERLEELLAHPERFTPDYSARYRMMIDNAEALTPHQAYAYNLLLGKDSSRGYQKLPWEKTFSFPQDDRPQFKYQCGWHFFVGSVFAENGREYGIQLMFWQVTLLPPDIAEKCGLSPLENQMVEIHFAISPAGDRHYRGEPYIVAGTTGLIEFSSSPYNYRVGKNFLRSEKNDSLFPLRLCAWGLDESEEKMVPFEIDLVLNQTKPYILEGEKGLAPSCGGVGTLYYSVPNLRIDPQRSSLCFRGEKVSLKDGKMWYDHQWGTGFLPGGNPRSEVIRALGCLESEGPGGWDWMALQFDDNTELTISGMHTEENRNFYNQKGSNPPGIMSADVAGLFIRVNGKSEAVCGRMKVTDWIRSTVSYGQYQTTNVWYPNRVEVDFPSGVLPEDKRHVILIPVVNSGQQGFFAAGSQYSEGAVYIENTEGKRIGRGFLESTNYADNLKQAAHLAGLPEEEKIYGLLAPPEISRKLKEECALFLLDPVNAARLEEELGHCKGFQSCPPPNSIK